MTQTDPTTTIGIAAPPPELSPVGRAALEDISAAVVACVRRMREKRAEEEEEERQRAAAAAATQKEANASPDKNPALAS